MSAPPTPATRLVFALHFHQPYGNLDHVFEDAVDRCYLRTVELLAAHPHVRTAIHVSGPLLEWARDHRPALLDGLRALVTAGQVEVLGGALQEAMLAILPDRDALGQLVRMADLCESLLGQRPRGMWLAERVWEPDLPRVIAAAGYRYTLLDDTHLFAAGEGPSLGGYYVTEKTGATVAVFPIDRGLRTRIPFADVTDLMAYLGGARGRTLTYGDDVEKFGLWPTTDRRVWERGWLTQMCEAFERSRDWLQLSTPSEVMQTERPAAPVYLPTISYAEMGAWTLPPDASQRYAALRQRLGNAGYEREADAFVRGGIWQAFLAKYSESRLIYRKMLRVSAAVERARERDDPRYAEARDALYRGQCNCAYWHGLFGGLYLQHLRAALTSALLEAEALVEPGDGRVHVTVTDHDGDLADEVLLEGPALNAYVAPHRGGHVFELDLRGPRVHLTGVLGRHPEAYHRDVARAQVVSDDELENISAHDLVRATEEGLAGKLLLDTYPRGAFVDHLLSAETTRDDFDRAYAPLVDLPNAPYRLGHVSEEGGEGTVDLSYETAPFRLDKRLHMTAGALEVTLRLRREGDTPRAVRLATEIDFSLLSPDTVGGRRLVVDGEAVDVQGDPLAPGTRASHRQVRSVRIAADSMGVDVELTIEPPATLWRIPFETVSQSERGFERAYQGTALVFVWDAPDELLETKVRMAVGPTASGRG